MKSSQVRELARRYATGKLSQENYRSQRRALIDSITGGQVQLAYREDERRRRPGRLNTKLLGFTVITLIAVGVGSVLMLRRSSGRAKPGAMPPAAVVPAPAPGPALVRTFVETEDWTDNSLQSFERRWLELDPAEQVKARDSLLYPRLVSEVRQQIVSEKAVAGKGADLHLAELNKFAKTLEIAPNP